MPHIAGHVEETTAAKGYLPPGSYIDPQSGQLFVRAPAASGSGFTLRALQPGETLQWGGGYFTFDPQAGGLVDAEEADIKRYLNTTGEGSRLTSDDPRYWELQWAQLNQDDRQFVENLARQKQDDGLNAESARQQALMSLIANRNSQQVNLAGTYGDIAANAAKFASAPEDTYADLLYRNAVGGATPFGAMSSNSEAAGARKTALEAKFQELFGPAAAALSRAGEFISSPPPSEFFGPEIRQQLGLPPTPAGALAAGSGGLPTAASAADPLAAAMAGDPRTQQQFGQDLERWHYGSGGTSPQVSGTQGPFAPRATDTVIPRPQEGYIPAAVAPDLKGFSGGGRINFDDIYDNRNKPGDAPTSTEGGLNINLNERALLVTESGKILATMGERRPDGTIRQEQVIVKPLPSEVEKDKKMKEQGKKFVESSKEAVKGFAMGGTINAIPDFSDLFRETRKQLQTVGGAYGGIGPSGGGTGVLPDLRFLAGAPFQALQDDPRLLKQVMAGYRTADGGGIDPETFFSTLNKFGMKAPSYNPSKLSFA